MLRAVSGICLLIILHRLRLDKWTLRVFPVLALLTIALSQDYYAAASHGQPAYRPLRKAYERLAKYEPAITQRGGVLVAHKQAYVICHYVGKGLCRGLDLNNLEENSATGETWPAKLESSQATFIYAGELVFGSTAGRQMVEAALAGGWKTLASVNSGQERWMLLEKPDSAPGSSAASGKETTAAKL